MAEPEDSEEAVVYQAEAERWSWCAEAEQGEGGARCGSLPLRTAGGAARRTAAVARKGAPTEDLKWILWSLDFVNGAHRGSACFECSLS